MATPDSSQPLAAKCLPRLVTGVERCGGMTVCDVVQTTFDDLETLYTDGQGGYRVDHVLTEVDFIGKACGATQHGFADWINATHRNWSRGMQGSRVTRDGRLEYEPFIRSRRKDPINNNMWAATWQSTDGADYTYDVTSPTGIPAATGFFPEGMKFFISSVNASDGTKTDAQLVVKSASIVGGKIRVVANSAQAGSVASAGSLGIPGVTANVLRQGVITRGHAIVTDYEEYCPQLPALATNRHAYYFVETIRLGLCESDLTQKFMRLLLEGNPYYKEFYHVDDVEYNRQVMTDWNNRKAWQFLYGKAQDVNQTATDWDKLPEVTLDEGDLNMPWDGLCVGRKADAVGVHDQLAECDRIWDLQRQQLPLGTLFQHLYEMRRIRKDNGIESNVIELMMDSGFALQFQTAMLRYFNARSEGLLRLNQELMKGGPQKDPWGFYWQSYILDFPQGLEIRVVTAPFLDDWIDAHRFAYSNGGNDYDLANAASTIWILDWSNIYEAILGSRTAENTTGDVSELARVNSGFLCRMKVPKNTYRLRSMDRTVVVDCAKSSLLIKNFDRCLPPDITGAGGCTTVFMSGWEPTFPDEPE